MLCKKCNTDKSQDSFRKDRSTKSGYHSLCKICNKENTKLYREANPEKCAEIQRRCIRNNPEKYAENLKRYREANPERYAEIQRRKRKAKPELYTELRRRSKVKRRASIAGNTGKIPSGSELQMLMLESNHTCIYCCSSPAVHIDHIVPISKMGSLGIENLAPSCAKCNLSKGAKLLKDWRPRHIKCYWWIGSLREHQVRKAHVFAIL